jgi:NAD(P)H-quinone oxidoreductase subunit I
LRLSIITIIFNYIRNIFQGAVSIASTCMTALPYVFRWGELHKEVTEGYPDPVSSKTADELPPRSRGILVNNIDQCIGCRECEKICPSQCIRIETEPQAEATKVWVSLFEIDHAKCAFCGLCVEVCGPNSLTHTRQYEGASYDLKSLIGEFGKGYITEGQRAKWAALRAQHHNKEDSLL